MMMTSSPTMDREPKKEHGRGAVTLDTAKNPGATAAREMIGVFESVGANAFDVTITDQSQNLIGFQRNQSAAKLSASIPFLLDATDRAERNLIIRPRGENERQFIQLDDLDGPGIERVKEVSFLIIETSRGSFQAWLCVADADENTARNLKVATSADATASGAARLCGSRNFKEIHSPHFPYVRTVEAHPGRTTRKEELSQSGLLKEEKATQPPARAPSRGFQSFTWPDYSIELSRAPKKKDGTIDASRADWNFSLIAADRGFTAQEITERLLEVSEKTQRMKDSEARQYAERTAKRAAESVARRNAQ
jgi:hypothetical protein